MRVNKGVKCLAQEHNVVPRPGLELGPFDPESRAQTIKPLFHWLSYVLDIIYLVSKFIKLSTRALRIPELGMITYF